MFEQAVIHGVQQALDGGGKTYASHPGRVRAQIFRVLASYPTEPCLAGGVLVAGIIAVAIFPFSPWILAAPITGLMWLTSSVYQVRSWFREGDVCAGVVVSEEPLLVATLTHLTTDISGSGPFWPAIRICREPRRRFTDAQAKRGTPVASIARYHGFPKLKPERWLNFEPKAVQCATSDEAEVSRLLAEISQERWRELQEGIKLVPRPFRPGLYCLWELRK
jgi:hypothetical protein